jgi:hypothetical protein
LSKGTEHWTYEGPELGVVQPRNLKGVNGRCSVKAGDKGGTRLDIAGIKFDIPRALAEELNAALSSYLRPYAGMSIFERVMEELDTVIARLMSGDGEAEDGRDPGRAEAFCMVLAILRNTYEPDYDQERQRAMDRYAAAEEDG